MLLVGRFAPNKGQIITLKAFAKVLKEISNARLWLVGGRGINREQVQYLEEIQRMADAINTRIGREVVKVIVDPPSVDQYYRVPMCVASSIAEEGYGLTVVECMAYGKPVIVSDIFVETGVASPDRAFVVRRNRPDELAKAIIHVYQNYKEALRRAEKGLEFAKKCSWEKVAEYFINLLKQFSCKS